MFEQILSGLSMVLVPQNFLWAALGVTFGMILGSIPGLTDNMGIVLLLPFTYYLGPIAGIALLMGLTKGGNFGGSIPAILFNIPGTPQAMVTCLDGYPLAQQGKSGKALKQALYSSVVADACSDLILIFLAAPVALIALKIGPPEYT
ncbi:MAG: tripartite tricarboxylate transporter permease, partial [Desulfobulbaceae bacterium]|nr:tripartite tricarboxylate transporter permease [Desulfobulbaceae bacterium]